MNKGELYIGTSNVVIPGSKQTFPERFQKLPRLTYYSTLFNTVELNSTFYKLPLPKTITRWVAETTQNFQFTLKLSRDITHRKPFAAHLPEVDNFFQVSDAMTEKRGCLLIQFPASVTEDYYDTVEKILKKIRHRNNSKWPVFVEFRHDSWYADHVYRMLVTKKVNLVHHDKRGSKTPVVDLPFPNRYLRFHGPNGDYRGTYSKEALSMYAILARKWLLKGITVYAYFNNTMGTAFGDAQTFRTLCQTPLN